MPLHFSPQTKRVFHLSLPIFAELLLQLLVGNMDQFMIAHFGSAAVASIGNGNQVMNVVIIVLTTMSTASTILLTQHIGAGRTGEECDEIATVGMTVIAVFSFAVGLFLLLDPEVLFRLLRTPEDAFAGACLYTRIVGGGVLLQGLYIELCAILRSYTLLKEVVAVSVVMNLLNVAGNAILINGFFGLPQLGGGKSGQDQAQTDEHDPPQPFHPAREVAAQRIHNAEGQNSRCAQKQQKRGKLIAKGKEVNQYSQQATHRCRKPVPPPHGKRYPLSTLRVFRTPSL